MVNKKAFKDLDQGWHENISALYQQYNHDSIMILSENITIFLIFSKYQPLLLLFT